MAVFDRILWSGGTITAVVESKDILGINILHSFYNLIRGVFLGDESGNPVKDIGKVVRKSS